MSRETFIDSNELHGGPLAHNHPPYDFTDLPPNLSLELRLLLQSRLDANRTTLRRHEYQHIRNRALKSGIASLLEGTETLTDCIYMSDTPVHPCFTDSSGQVKAHVRFAMSVVLEVGWPLDIMDRDRWYEHDYGRINARVKTLSFAGFESHWVKQWAKQFIHYELTIGKAWSTATSYGGRLLPFARFVARNHPEMRGPQDVSRKFLLEYIGWINRQPNVAASQRQALVSAVKVLLEEHRVNEWTPHIAESAVIRQGELPKRAEALPRPIDESIRRQIIDSANLVLISPELRLLLQLLDGHGFRAGTVVSLEIDCLTEDADGFPALRYWNRKRTRERLHPIRDPELPDLIREQQRRARKRHPNTTYLFPKTVANVAANQHYPVSTLQVAFATYLDRAGITGPDGSPAHVTIHQFRHTFGTRELNNGVSQDVVQELLDHDDPKTTRIYARLTNTRLRDEFLGAARFNVEGQRLEQLLPESPLADLSWMKEKLNRARVTLPNGYCGLPLQQNCDVQNACLDCTKYFITTPEFLPAHEGQLNRTRSLIEDAEANGHTRMAEKNRPTFIKLSNLVESLRTAAAEENHVSD